MPCPEALADAVTAGLFGFDEQRVVVPSADDVRALTEEHVRELLNILVDLDHLQRCALVVVDPVNGKSPRGSDKRQALAERLAREAEKLQRDYDDMLAAYADAFGLAAADVLDRFVKENWPATPAGLPPRIQQELF